MSTSPEAQAAARKFNLGVTHIGGIYFELGYDTATAKAREDILQLSQALQCCKAERVLERAKAREELEHIRIAANGHFEKDGLNIPIPLARRVYLMSCALVHQQPSAITTKYGDHGTTCYYCDPPVQGEPSAPTADVEKIPALAELHHRFAEDTHIRTLITQALYQARAPLVEALRRVRLVLWQDVAYPYDGKVIRDLDAALTGTGEKECLK